MQQDILDGTYSPGVFSWPVVGDFLGWSVGMGREHAAATLQQTWLDHEDYFLHHYSKCYDNPNLE